MLEQATVISTISEVFIRPGCTVCGLCEDNCAEVFDVRADTSVVRDSAGRYYRSRALAIVRAAEECPVSVIRVRGFNEAG
jgi:ferredoxin